MKAMGVAAFHRELVAILGLAQAVEQPLKSVAHRQQLKLRPRLAGLGEKTRIH